MSHVPVMLAEMLADLAPRDGGLYVDGTFGAGGYSRAILAAAEARVIGIDRDPRARVASEPLKAAYPGRFTLAEARFGDLGGVLDQIGARTVDGVVLDLGVSSMQLDQAERGFSFRADGPLDMRMGGEGPSAAEVVAELTAGELQTLFSVYGEEKRARRAAEAIVRAREEAPIETTARLASVVEAAIGQAELRIHPATRVFQALRIYVNRELETLPSALAAAVDVLRPGGRLAVLSYHSLEDRIVKRFIAAERRGCTCPPELPVCVCGRQPRLAPIGPQPRRPSATEVERNARSRSALLRAARKLAA
jgi:16S rRNA (cytosine1402-N4)-methyltransferase